jgi:hypothetical protein
MGRKKKMMGIREKGVAHGLPIGTSCMSKNSSGSEFCWDKIDGILPV